jgi:hypothetical protein
VLATDVGETVVVAALSLEPFPLLPEPPELPEPPLLDPDEDPLD